MLPPLNCTVNAIDTAVISRPEGDSRETDVAPIAQCRASWPRPARTNTIVVHGVISDVIKVLASQRASERGKMIARRSARANELPAFYHNRKHNETLRRVVTVEGRREGA